MKYFKQAVCGLVGNSNDEVIIAGGFSDNNAELDSVEILSLESFSWKSGTSLLNEIYYASIVGYKDTVLISGGSSQNAKGEIFQVIGKFYLL